ncbi:MAG: hypothetical protein ACK56F_22600, partial [bacterium]
ILKVTTVLTIVMITLQRTLDSTTKMKTRALLSYIRVVTLVILIIMREVKEKKIINNHQRANNKKIEETAM